MNNFAQLCSDVHDEPPLRILKSALQLLMNGPLTHSPTFVTGEGGREEAKSDELYGEDYQGQRGNGYGWRVLFEMFVLHICDMSYLQLLISNQLLFSGALLRCTVYYPTSIVCFLQEILCVSSEWQ